MSFAVSSIRCCRIWIGLLCFLYISLLVALPQTAYAQTNPTYLENQNDGTRAWKLSNPSDDVNLQIKGYASATSVDQGEDIIFHVTTSPAQDYDIEIYRMGWYGGSGGRLMKRVSSLNGAIQPIPVADSTTGLLELNWSPSYTLSIPVHWTSGAYLAKLINADGFESFIPFIVRDDDRIADFLFQQSVTTYQAYNNFPNDGSTGKSLYRYQSNGDNTITGGPEAAKVSFDRPYAEGDGAGQFFKWEHDLIQWMERVGYDVTYSTNIDTHANGAELLNHKAFLSTGHDEYWTKEMYDAAETARDQGTHLAFMGANAVYWQIRLEDSAANVPNRVVVSYKNEGIDPEPDLSQKTITFRDTGRPEQLLRGVMYEDFNARDNTDFIVQNSGHWIYEQTGLSDGDSILEIVGYEVDVYAPSIPLPANITATNLSLSPFVAKSGANVVSTAILFQSPSEAWVFSSGTMSWSDALNRYWVEDSRLQQTTANLFERFVNSSTAPIVITPGEQSNFWQDNVSLPINATNPGGGSLTYEADNLPGGLTINPNTGQITGQVWQGSVGTEYVLVSVSNGFERASVFFPWAINQPGAGECRSGPQEAEAGKIFGNYSTVMDSNASGGKYLHVAGGGRFSFSQKNRVEYCFTVTAAGNYRIKGWAAAPSADSNSTFFTVDGSPTAPYVWKTDQSTNFVEDYLSNEGGSDPVIVNLTAGNHILTLYQNDEKVRLDKFELEPIFGNLPEVTITTPTSGAVFDVGDTVEFVAEANDEEDGNISSDISWYSSINGSIGTGASISTDSLAAGNHQISASVLDSSGFTASDAISINVTAPTDPPGETIQISPEGTITENPPTFMWTKATNATSYRVFVRNQDTAEIAHDHTYMLNELNCSDNACSVVPADSSFALADYQWNVRGLNTNGPGPWSSNMHFAIENGGTTTMPLGTAQLISPLGSIADSAPSFEWGAVAMATSYRLVVYHVSTKSIQFEGSYTAAEADCNSGSTCIIQPVDLSLQPDEYRWLIQAANETSTGPWSTYAGP